MSTAMLELLTKTDYTELPGPRLVSCRRTAPPGNLHPGIRPPADSADRAEGGDEAVQFGVRLGRVPDLQVFVSPSCGKAVASLN